MKVCTKCNTPKELDNYPKNKNHKDGFHVWCKGCVKEYKIQNKEIIKKQRKEYDKQYYLDNRSKIMEYCNKYFTNRVKTDINFKLKLRIKSRIFHSLFGKYISKSVLNLLGCSIKYLKQYLEQKFIQGMSWENYGKVWEIDHIIPCSSFDLTNIEQQKECFNYKNLMPRFKTTEIAKQCGSDQMGNRNKLNKIL